MKKLNVQAIAEKIAHRAVAKAAAAEVRVNWTDVFMAIIVVHGGTPLRLTELLEADDFNFSHDVFGILRHLDRESGELQNCFVPRFTARA
jgi:hypothetical protein